LLVREREEKKQEGSKKNIHLEGEGGIRKSEKGKEKVSIV